MPVLIFLNHRPWLCVFTAAEAAATALELGRRLPGREVSLVAVNPPAPQATLRAA